MIPKASASLVLTVLLTSLPAHSYAGDPTRAPLFTFNGFGTLGAVYSNEKSGDFTLHALQKEEGPGDDWSAKVERHHG